MNEALPEAVIERAPSAELSAGQKDEDSLPPYHVLDTILAAYLDDGQTEAQIVKSGFAEKTVRCVIRQYHRMAFKREQTPKALSLS